MNKARTSNKGILFVVSAPSGAGKTTIVTQAIQKDRRLKRTVSHTTRSPRTGERHGKDYFFVDSNMFSQMKKKGEFVESARVYQESYGTSYKTIQSGLKTGKDMVLVIEGKGAKQIKKKYADAVFILLLPPSLKELRKRIRGRGDTPAKTLALREAAAKAEVRGMAWYDYVVVNDKKSQAVKELLNIVTSERLKLGRNKQLVKNFS